VPGEISTEVGNISKEVGNISTEVGNISTEVGNISKEVGKRPTGLAPSRLWASRRFDASHKALGAFLHAALNHPRAARMLAGEKTRGNQTAVSRDEAEDHNTGVSLLRGLHAYLRDQSRASRRFFRDVVHDARVMRLLDESAAVVGRWYEQHRTGEREAFDRMQRMRSLEFAQIDAAKLRDLLPARGVGAGTSIH
jgi:hypothetical protein